MKSLCLIGVAVALTTVCLIAQGPGKPVKTDIINTHFKAPPHSLSEMLTQVDAVVRGRIIGGSPRDLNLGGRPGARVMTSYGFQVLEVLHVFGSFSIASDKISILREGGSRDRGPYVESVVQEGFPPFDVGHEYVLFLKWSDGLEGWVPAFGPDGVVDLQSGRVQTPGTSTLMNSQRGKTAADFVRLVRRFGHP
jgi:hypothetical protein